MRQALACFLLLAIGVLPTLGTPHAHMPHGDSVAAVQHTHGIGLDHDSDAQTEHHEDGEPARGTRNLDGDQLVLAQRISAVAPISLRGTAGWHSSSAADGVLADRAPAGADGFSITRPPPRNREQVEIRVTAPRRGPPQPSV